MNMLDFRRVKSGLLKDLLGRMPWDRAHKGRGAQERWIILKDFVFQAQEQCIPMKRESGRRPGDLYG